MSVKPIFDAFRDYFSLQSEPIVRDWLDGFDWNLNERNILANSQPASIHLDGILDHVGRGEQRLMNEFIKVQPQIHWAQRYNAEDFGQDFVDNFAHVELIGTEGHYVSNDIAAGFIILGPNSQYPEHWHVAEEIYFPMTNASLWSRDETPFVQRNSGEFIYHESNTPHAIKTDDAPLLAAWIWRGGDLAQKCNY